MPFNGIILAAGIKQKNKKLGNLPFRIISAATGAEAIRYLKHEDVDVVISQWKLPDMRGGEFLRKLMAVKLNLPTIACVEAGNKKQEIEARRIGVSAVLAENTAGEYMSRIVCELIGFNRLLKMRKTAEYCTCP